MALFDGITNYFNTFGRIKYLEDQLQAATKIDVLSPDVLEESRRYTGNAFKVYATAVKAISDRYNATADWGNLLTGNIIDLRAIFIISQGIKVIPRAGVQKGEAEKELTWANDFLEFNDLDAEAAQEYAKEAEIEGKIALKLFTKKLESGEFKDYQQMISVRYIPWTRKEYEVITDEQDYLDYTQLVWTPTGKDKKEVIEKPNFVYKKFGGRVDKPNEAQPKIMKCLTEVDNVTKALRDWREINRLFASPIPDFQAETKEQAKYIQDEINKKNWKIKKAFVHTGSFEYKSPPMTGVDSLEKEILRLVTFISGTTGVPVHWLGLTELLKQRATADDLREMANTATSKERIIWAGAYDEVIKKSMDKINTENQAGEGAKKLDPDKIKVVIPTISREQWLHLEKVLLPLSLAGKISDKTLLSNVPGIDVQDEMKFLEEKAAGDFERIKADNDRLSQELQERRNAIPE